jgi:YqjK-like protein
MNHRELERQQKELLDRSSYLRARLGAELGHWQRPLGLVDGVLLGIHWLGRHPLWGVGAALALTAKGPRRILLRVLKGIWQRAMP